MATDIFLLREEFLLKLNLRGMNHFAEQCAQIGLKAYQHQASMKNNKGYLSVLLVLESSGLAKRPRGWANDQ